MNDLNSAMSLSMEQEFIMQVYQRNLPKLSPEQKDEIILECTRQLMIKENVIKHLIMKEAMAGFVISLSDFDRNV
jgi:glyceraldehyde-3-phosphate dehydrogenase/erythrose-4-phosphate dehydrogenase